MTEALALCYCWLTPAAPAGVAVLRCTRGPALLDRALPTPGRARFARLLDPGGQLVDEVVVTAEDEERLELACHGGPAVRQRVDACLAAWDYRPDSVALAGSASWSRFAAVEHPAALAYLLAHEGAPPPVAWARWLDRMPVILLTGAANAGKSTLLNAWCGHQRALVSEVPGTTRDLVAARAECHGWRVRVLDSAGLRDQADAIERAGQALVEEARAIADLVIHLDGLEPASASAAPRPGDLRVLGKADRRNKSEEETVLCWSAPAFVGDARAGRYLERLADAVCERLGLPAAPAS